MAEEANGTNTKQLNEDKNDGCFTLIAADDGSLPVRTDEEKQAMLEQRKMFEMDSYHKYIQNQTYKTEFIPVSFEQAQALKSHFRGMNANDNEHFIKLKESINTAIKQLQKSMDGNNRFFIRMSTRSPKDACGLFSFIKSIAFVFSAVHKQTNHYFVKNCSIR